MLRQFAVLSFGDLEPNLAPQPLQKNAPLQGNNNNDPSAGFTYLSYEGLPNVHSEQAIGLYVAAVAARQPATSVAHLYSENIPCSTCVASIASWTSAIADRLRLFTYYQQYSGASDWDNYQSLVGMQKAGWDVKRVCPEGESCGTFQQSVKDCVLARPVVCEFCQTWARENKTKDFVEDTFAKVKSKASTAWAAAVLQIGWSKPEEGRQVSAAFADCVSQYGSLPVGTPMFRVLP